MIKKYRMEKGLSKEEVAKLLCIDIKRYIEIERDKKICTFIEKYKLSMLLNIPLT